MIKFTQKGDFKNIEKFMIKNGKGLNRNKRFMSGLQKFAEEGVKRLKEYTPRDTGKTANSWDYKITVDSGRQRIKIDWINTNQNDGANIAMLIQYGHATSSGYYIEGVDYINPALKGIFDKLGNEAVMEVTGNAYY